MLLLAILLLLADVGLLLAALVTGQNALAWGSVGVSAALAVVLLILSRRSGRRRREAARAAQAAADAALDDDPYVAGHLRPHPPESSEAESSEAESSEPEPSEPDEEDTDAADLLVIWELADEVLVVDERPRYHLARCGRLGAAQTERLPIREARELGFTPCDQCRPDASLARRRRAALVREEQDAERTEDGALSSGREVAHSDAGEEQPGEETADAGQQPVPAGGSRNTGGNSPENADSEAAKER